jgi:mono/diheme cytochrome c family protein
MAKQPVTETAGTLDALKEKLPALLVLVVVLGGAAVFLVNAGNFGDDAKVDVRVPALSDLAQRGERLFAKNCVQCHGKDAGGGPGGPPLIHRIYTPGHHSDGSFLLAFQRGVPQHHWDFGNMPPQPQIGKEQALAIIRYVREVQRANGIGVAQR